MVMNIYDAKMKLSQLVERAAKGEEIVIAKAGKPLARLVPLAPARKRPRKPGGSEGKIWVAPDFDAPLPKELLDAFEGKTPESALFPPKRPRRRRKKP